MNLALHGFLLQVILSIVDLKYGLCSAGEPGYLDFDNLPETNFSCQGKVIGGYYADVEAGCQMFHVCTIGQKDEIMDIKFLCLNGTVFDQETRVCERVDEVDCSKSERFYNLNLELYGNNAVTLSLHEESLNDDEPPILIDDHHQTTSGRPPTTTSTTTTPRPALSSTTSPNPGYPPALYPQPFQHQPPFPSVQTSQSKSHYDDKNGGYHRQYIYHNSDQNEQSDSDRDTNQATSYQLFSNQGASSTTHSPQIHQISTVSPLYHATSSTLQSLLTGNANPPLINPLFHNHGIISTTEQFTVHNSNPRETDYQRNTPGMHQKSEDRPLLEAIQSTNQGRVSKLTISPVPQDPDKHTHKIKSETSQLSGFLSIPPSDTGPPTVRSFYPTPKSSKSETSTPRLAQHIHLPPPPPIPQLKPHQVTIHLSPPEIQRLVQNPSPLLPSQSRVIVTAKASVSDESGRPLNTTQLVTLPLPTVPASYDDYKEGDESFDPFYRDVPKIRNIRKSDRFVMLLGHPRRRRMIRPKRSAELNSKVADESSEQFYDQEFDVTTVMSTNIPDGTIPPGAQETTDYKDEEYEDQYLNDSQRAELNSLEKNDTAEVSQADDQYTSQEYFSSDEIDKNLTSIEYFEDSEDLYQSTTEVPEAAITETTQQLETTVKSNKAEDTVVKFTEEIPQADQGQIPEDSKAILIETPSVYHDYVDDNYEPESYIVSTPGLTTDVENVTASVTVTSDIEELDERIATTSATTLASSIESAMDETTVAPITTAAAPTTTTTPSTTTTPPPATTTTRTPSTTTPPTTPTTPTTPTPSTTPTPRTTASSTPTSPTSTTSPTSITHRPYTTPSTTSYRPTSPKFKAFPTRKTYIYNPPTTTPVPVIIKTRLPLFNPNPAKPPKSYSDLAPKPVIRKRPLLARRGSTTLMEQELEVSTTESDVNKLTKHSPPIPELAKASEPTERTSELSEKFLERISEAVGEGIIEQINGLSTTTIDTNDFVDIVTSRSTSTVPSLVMENVSSMTTEGVEDAEGTTEATNQFSPTSDINLTTKLEANGTLSSVLPVRKPMVTYKRVKGFNCLEKEMYRFYADKRDCRLFHYCSPGFTDRQVLDFRFVCEEGTIFDEDTQSCLHEVKNAMCRERTW